MDNTISEVWDIEADLQVTKLNIPISLARDLIIVEWLYQAGDAAPYSDWVRRGHEPRIEVQKLLGEMLDPTTISDEHLSFSFKRYSKSPGRPIKLEARRLRWLFAETVKARIDEGENYDSAVQFIHEYSVKIDREASVSSIRKAYDETYGKKARQKTST